MTELQTLYKEELHLRSMLKRIDDDRIRILNKLRADETTAPEMERLGLLLAQLDSERASMVAARVYVQDKICKLEAAETRREYNQGVYE